MIRRFHSLKSSLILTIPGIYGSWVGWKSGTSKVWTQISDGGNPGGYAQGQFADSNLNRTLLQAIEDGRASAGPFTLTFDYMLSDQGSVNASLAVSVWGWNADDEPFEFSLNANDTIGATNLAYREFSSNTDGWASGSIEGTVGDEGYDMIFVKIDAQKANMIEGDILGVDNVKVDIPGTATFTLLAGLMVLSCVVSMRRRTDSSSLRVS